MNRTEIFERQESGPASMSSIIDPRTPADARAAKMALAEKIRDAGIFPGTVSWTGKSPAVAVYLRGSQDVLNLHSIGLQALRQVLSGAAALAGVLTLDSTPIKYRDANDLTHSLTPAQALDMASFLIKRGMAWYEAAWAHETALNALSTVADIDAYDIKAGWPT